MLHDEAVAGNRWDRLGDWPRSAPVVSVVVTHFEQPEQLQRTYRALTLQTLVPAEIVVADDGSRITPRVAAGGPPTLVVTQPDRGFRAAAARNLGARHCHGDVLVFLDADTSPEPDFLRSLTRRVAQSRDVVAVGRRRHADLSGLPVDAEPAAAPQLAEPAWLRDAYTASRNLLDADGRSFRYVLSAVLACRRQLYEELGGFDERFVGYGGEDWDFAYRAWNAGGVLVHEPLAVAWHDGAEWAGRETSTGHDRQSVRLAALIPEPRTRGAPLPSVLPDVLVDIEPAGTATVATVIRCVHSVLRQEFGDLRVRSDHAHMAPIGELYGEAVRSEPWTPDQQARARARLVVRRPLPQRALRTAMEMLVSGDLGCVEILAGQELTATLTSTRALGRARRWRDRISYDRVVEGHFGCRRLEMPPIGPSGDDLAAFFAGVERPSPPIICS